MKYTIHPYCAAFPDIEGKEFDELVEHIKHHGQQEPIWTYKGQIIDGKNRLRALIQIRREPIYQEWKPINSDPVAIDIEMRHFVVAKNIMRRNLSVNKRATIGANLVTATHGGDRKSDGKNQETLMSLDPVTIAEAAAETHVSPSTIKNALAVKEHASAAVKDAVAADEVTITDAAAVADLPKAEQNAAVKAVKSGKAKTLKAAAKKKPPKKTAEPREAGDAPVELKHTTKPTLPEIIETAGTEFRSLILHVKTGTLDRVKAIAAGHGGAFLTEAKVSEIENRLVNAVSAIKDCKPVAVCDYCEGKGCKTCHKSGYLPDHLHRNAPKKG